MIQTLSALPPATSCDDRPDDGDDDDDDDDDGDDVVVDPVDNASQLSGDAELAPLEIPNTERHPAASDDAAPTRVAETDEDAAPLVASAAAANRSSTASDDAVAGDTSLTASPEQAAAGLDAGRWRLIDSSCSSLNGSNRLI